MSQEDILNEIVSSWEEDSAIDKTQIQSETLSTPLLHSKYLKMFALWKKRKHSYTVKMNNLRREKTRYFRGEMSKEELKELGWSQYQGNRLLKSELEEALKNDFDIIQVQEKIDLIDTAILLLESILKMISSRDFQISNYIKYVMFSKGEIV